MAGRKVTRRRLLRITGALLGFILLLLITAYVIALTQKKEILSLITRSINEKMSGDLLVGKMDFSVFERFPSLSVQLHDVFITDSMTIRRHRDTVFRADEISLQIAIPTLISGPVGFKSVKINRAFIFISKDMEGNTNIPRPHSSGKTGKMELPSFGKVFLQNISFLMTDSVKRKRFSYRIHDAVIKQTGADSSVNYFMSSSIHFGELIFNHEKGGYLTNQEALVTGDVSFNPYSKIMQVRNAELNVQNQRILVKGHMNFQNETMQWDFRSYSIMPKVANAMLTPATAEKLAPYPLQKPLMMRAFVSGSFAPNTKPMVDAYFKTSGNTMEMQSRTFENLTLLGWFSNHVDSTKVYDDYNSRLMLPVFYGEVYQLPIHAQMVITNLVDPFLSMKGSVDYDAEKQEKITSQHFRILSGKWSVNFLFHAPMINYVDTINRELKADISGNIMLENIGFTHLHTGYEFRNINGYLSFHRPNLVIDSISLDVNGNHAVVTGTAENFIAFAFVPEVKANVNLTVKADTVNFNKFKPPLPADSTKKKAERKKSKQDFVPSFIDWMVENLELNLTVEANRLTYKRFTASDISSQLILHNDYVMFKDASMKTAGGVFKFHGSVTGLTKSTHNLAANLIVRDAEIDLLMRSFDNFNQSVVTHENVKGTISAAANFSTRLDQQYRVISSSMGGDFTVFLKEGELTGFDGLAKISNYIFKNRDFTDIQFSRLSNQTTIKGTLLSIDQCDVYSSVLTLFVEGIYDFEKTQTDLLVTVPLQNLKKMDAEERMAQEDSTAKKGGSLVFRASYNDSGELKIAPVLFGKKKKDSETL